MADPIQKLSKILETIQDVALETHEFIESQGRIPLAELESMIFTHRDVSVETRANLIWPFLIFTRPRLNSQNDFQNT